jgi:hypothetical protein
MVNDPAYQEVFQCLNPEREWIEMQRLEAFIVDSPGAIASYLDEHWRGWREGTPETDYILYASPVTEGATLMIGPDNSPGFLNVDGERYYSSAWL